MIPYIVGRGLGPALSQLTFRASRMFQVPVEQDSWSWFVDYGGPFNRNGGSGEPSPPSVTRKHVVGGVEGACRESRFHLGGDRWGSLASSEGYALHLRF